MTRRLRFLAALLLGSLALSGCDFDVYKLPLPGGPDIGDDPITVTVEFRDVLDLVPKSTVKVADVSVGRVSDINLDGETGQVTIKMRNDTGLPSNAESCCDQRVSGSTSRARSFSFPSSGSKSITLWRLGLIAKW